MLITKKNGTLILIKTSVFRLAGLYSGGIFIFISRSGTIKLKTFRQ